MNSSPAKTFFLGAAIAGGIIYFGLAASASASIVINEIMYDLPGSDDPHEWIEAYNPGPGSVTVETGTGGWRFYDGSNHIINAPAQGSVTIPAGGFAIFADDAQTFLADHAGFSGTVFDTVMSLNNTADTLRILDENGTAIDEVAYANSVGAQENGKTLERGPDGVWHESAQDGGTPGTQNSSPQPPTPSPTPTPSSAPTPAPSPSPTATSSVSPAPTPTPAPTSAPSSSPSISPDSPIPPPSPSPSAAPTALSKIHINEFLPNTEGTDAEEEWIELWNEEHIPADISGWTIDDAEGGSKPYVIPQGTVIPAKSFLVLLRQTTDIALNNEGDSVRLMTPGGQVYEIVTYEKAPTGYSSNRLSVGEYVWSNMLTPGSVNIIASESAQATTSEAPSSPLPAASPDTGTEPPEEIIEPKSAATRHAAAKNPSLPVVEDGTPLTAAISDTLPQDIAPESFFSRHSAFLLFIAAAAAAVGIVKLKKHLAKKMS